MNKPMLKFTSKVAVTILVILGLIELGLAMWTVLEGRYKTLAYNLADVGYIDLWILRYVSMCLFASSIITLVMCLILIWGFCSAHVFIFISSVMLTLVVIGELTIGIMTFASKFQTRLILQEQLPKLVITYRQGNDERASRALDFLQITFRCCGSDGRLSFQNNVPFSCNMYSVGCLPRTMFFLDSCMDLLAAVLLFFSLIKLLLVIFFFTFLCVYRRHQRKHPELDPNLPNNSSRWHHSSSFDSSSSSDNLPKKMLISSPIVHQENDYIEKRQVVLNEYDSQTLNKRVQNAAMILPPSTPPQQLNQHLSTPSLHEQQTSRKLSSISEKTEKTETDDSDPDLLRVKHYTSKRKAIITAVNPQTVPPPLPKKLPTIKNPKKAIRAGGEDDNDSGLEHSSSEKSSDEQNSTKRHSATSSTETLTKSKPTPTLSFSNVFVTSVSQGDITTQPQNDEFKKSLTTSPSSSSTFSDQLLLTDVTTPKPILKKSPPQSSPSSDQDRIPPSYQDQKKISSILNARTYVKVPQTLTTNNSTKIYVPYKTKENSLLNNLPKPAPAPRPSLKQSSLDKQDESLV